MKMTFRMVSAFQIVILFGLLGVHAQTSDLHGLKGVGVNVESIDNEDAQLQGVTKDGLLRAIDSTLILSGVRVFTQEECWASPGSPYLSLHVDVLPVSDVNNARLGYTYDIQLQLKENVKLIRSPEKTVEVITWEEPRLGFVGRDGLGHLKDVVMELLGTFVSLYSTSNR